QRLILLTLTDFPPRPGNPGLRLCTGSVGFSRGWACAGRGRRQMDQLGGLAIIVIVVIAFAIFALWRSLWTIGPTEVGLVRKRFSFRNLKSGSPVAFHGEAGYQAQLLSPGLRFKLWPFFVVTRHPMVQIPAGQIGVVIAQAGAPLPIGAKSAVFKPVFGNFQDLATFMDNGGQEGVPRAVRA